MGIFTIASIVCCALLAIINLKELHKEILWCLVFCFLGVALLSCGVGCIIHGKNHNIDEIKPFGIFMSIVGGILILYSIYLFIILQK